MEHFVFCAVKVFDESSTEDERFIFLIKYTFREVRKLRTFSNRSVKVIINTITLLYRRRGHSHKLLATSKKKIQKTAWILGPTADWRKFYHSFFLIKKPQQNRFEIVCFITFQLHAAFKIHRSCLIKGIK